jgi:anti-sigma regulatory factor (Ser/Thr protein kinase)
VSTTSLRDETHLVYRFDAASEGAVWLARQLCEQWLRERHVRSDAISDLLLVTTELCTGVAYGEVVLRVGAEGADVDVTVESAGTATVVLPPGDDLIRPAGGDLRLAAALCDRIVLEVTPERTVVRARRHGVVLPD